MAINVVLDDLDPSRANSLAANCLLSGNGLEDIHRRQLTKFLGDAFLQQLVVERSIQGRLVIVVLVEDFIASSDGWLVEIVFESPDFHLDLANASDHVLVLLLLLLLLLLLPPEATGG